MKIQLCDTFTPRIAKNFPLTKDKDKELQAFLDENLSKGYIRPSTSEMASAFFFIKKKDGKLCPVQDYRYLNEHTYRDAYLLPRVDELMDQLKDAKWFTKLDLRWGYNNVRIKEGDEHKFAVKAGDQIKMTATATSTSAGSVTLQNLSTGKSVSKSFSGETNR